MVEKKGKRLMKLLLIGAGMMVLISGCSSSLKYGSAKISSRPEGAEVINLKDDSHLGVTPVNVSFGGEADTAEFVTVQLRKPGYIDRITSFWINRRHETQLEADDNAIDISVELEKTGGN
jgi:hypothetical protein